MSPSVRVAALLAIILAFTVASVIASIPIPHASLGPLSERQARNLFEKFMRKYDKLYYGSQQSKTAFETFWKNIERARQMNLEHGENIYGITKFSDMDSELFAKTHLLPKFTPAEFAQKMGAKKQLFGLSSYRNSMANLTSWDWREHGAVTPIKDQGSCGSCWSFSTTGNIEGAWFLSPKGGKLVTLSEQNLIDCDHNCDAENNCDEGCDGGFMWNAYKYIIENGGIDTEDSYPYEAMNGDCRYKNSTRGATISSWTMLPTDEDILAAWLAKNGPVAVALNAQPLRYYVGGVCDPVVCDPEGLNHAVLLVGFGSQKNSKGEDQKYWIVKNSWGTNWGEQGYFKMARGKNTCGIASVPQTAIV